MMTKKYVAGDLLYTDHPMYMKFMLVIVTHDNNERESYSTLGFDKNEIRYCEMIVNSIKQYQLLSHAQ